MSETVLVVEDQSDIAVLIREALEDERFVYVHAASVSEGWRNFESLRPALVVLDVGLPDGSGLDLCRKIRGHKSLSATPVIVLTGKGELADKISGFDAGADHYLVKPVAIKELRLWAHALLRRVQLADADGGILREGSFALDPQTHTVTTASGEVRNLTRKEFEILYELMRRRPKVLSKEQIMKALWNTVLRDNTIEVHIRNLRNKLGAEAAHVATVSGVGYKFE
jgi:DNA-binding response OmpR family regulator